MTNYYAYDVKIRYYGKESSLHVLRLNAATSRDDARNRVIAARARSADTLIEEVKPIRRTTKPEWLTIKDFSELAA